MMASSRNEPLGTVVWPPSLREHKTVRLARHIGRHAEPGAGPEHDHRRVRRWLAAADRAEVVGGEMRQRPGDRFEIIDDVDVGESEAGAKLGRIDDPRIVRKRAALAFDHAGYAQRSR